MQKKTDRRVRKTKSQLRKGLAHLMKEKSIGEITVKELVDEVDINRSTFYLHYSDIPTLLREIENEMMDEMKRAIHDHPIDRENDSAFSFIKDIFQVLDRNREIGCALIGPYGDIGFIHKMEDLLEENSREVLLQMFQGLRRYKISSFSSCIYYVQERVQINFKHALSSDPFLFYAKGFSVGYLSPFG